MTAPVSEATSGVAKMMRRLARPVLLRAYMAAKLPMGAWAGLRIVRLDGRVCEASVPFSWRTQNPFSSIYFAALSMAAELSCAGIALSAARGAPEPVAVLPVGMEATFDKKATDDTTFRCEDGAFVFEAVNETLRTGEATTCVLTTTGTMPDGTVVSRFTFTWSFKRKR